MPENEDAQSVMSERSDELSLPGIHPKVGEFTHKLRVVRREAGEPSLRLIVSRANSGRGKGEVHLSVATLRRLLNGEQRMPQWEQVELCLLGCSVSQAAISTWWLSEWIELKNIVDPDPHVVPMDRSAGTASPAKLLGCRLCGVVVDDAATHARWHGQEQPESIVVQAVFSGISCARCGARLTDPEVHTRWHDDEAGGELASIHQLRS